MYIQYCYSCIVHEHKQYIVTARKLKKKNKNDNFYNAP